MAAQMRYGNHHNLAMVDDVQYAVGKFCQQPTAHRCAKYCTLAWMKFKAPQGGFHNIQKILPHACLTVLVKLCGRDHFRFGFRKVANHFRRAFLARAMASFAGTSLALPDSRDW